MGACVGYLIPAKVRKRLKDNSRQKLRSEYLATPLDKLSVNYDISDSEWLLTAMEDESQEVLDNLSSKNSPRHKSKSKGKHETAGKMLKNVQKPDLKSEEDNKNNNPQNFCSKDEQKCGDDASIKNPAKIESKDIEQNRKKSTKTKTQTQTKSKSSDDETPLFWLSSDDDDDPESTDELFSLAEAEAGTETEIGDSPKNPGDNQSQTQLQKSTPLLWNVCPPDGPAVRPLLKQPTLWSLDENAKKLSECCESGDLKSDQQKAGQLWGWQ